MGKSLKLTTFGSQTLSDSTDYKQKDVVDSSDTPLDSLYRAIDGTWFDAAGSDTNTLVPAPVTCRIFVTGSSAANYKTNTNNIDALNGTKDTLTGEYADGTTVTCTARCRVEPVITDTSSFLVPVSEYNLTFLKLTSWA